MSPKAGLLLRRLQKGDALTMPHSRPMPSIGKGCHELRIVDGDLRWRIVYLVDRVAVVVLEVFAKKTRATPEKVIDACKARLSAYRDARR